MLVILIQGYCLGSDYKRYSGRANVESKVGRFTVGANTNYAYAVKNGFSQSTSGSMSNTTVAAVSFMNPFRPFYNEDGTYYGTPFGESGYYNPLALTDKELGDINESKNETLNLNPYVQIDIWNGIYYRTNLVQTFLTIASISIGLLFIIHRV